MGEIAFQDGDVIPVLGKKWILKLRKSTDEEWLILTGGNMMGLIFPTENGGFMYVLTDKGDPRETFAHELNEIFLTEMGRILNERGGEEV